MKKSIIAAAVLAVVASTVFAAPKAAARSSDRQGRSAIGAGLDGIGYRHWVSDENAWDLNFGFSSGKDTRSFELGAQYLNLLRSKGNLNFMSMFGIQYGNTSNDVAGITNKQTDIILGAGLSVEYFFDELPDLGFSSTLTGIQYDMRSVDVAGASTSSSILSTVPGMTFAVRYYYK